MRTKAFLAVCLGVVLSVLAGAAIAQDPLPGTNMYYEVWRSTASNFSNPVCLNVGGINEYRWLTDTWFTDTSASIGTPYYYKVRGITAATATYTYNDPGDNPFDGSTLTWTYPVKTKKYDLWFGSPPTDKSNLLPVQVSTYLTHAPSSLSFYTVELGAYESDNPSNPESGAPWKSQNVVYKTENWDFWPDGNEGNIRPYSGKVVDHVDLWGKEGKTTTDDIVELWAQADTVPSAVPQSPQGLLKLPGTPSTVAIPASDSLDAAPTGLTASSGLTTGVQVNWDPAVGQVTEFTADAVMGSRAQSGGRVQWVTGEGANGHWYERVDTPTLWPDAKTASEQMTFGGVSGHLVTVASPEENNFVFANLVSGAPHAVYELGGFQVDNLDEPAGHWAWVTGEFFDSFGWGQVEPNNGQNYNPGPEDYLMMYRDSGINAAGSWGDFGLAISGAFPFIVEYDTPEPATLALLAIGGAGLIGGAIRRRR